MRRWLPACAGLAGIVASVVAADVWAIHTDRPTISEAAARSLDHTVGGPVVFGIGAGLAWHLYADPIIRRLARAAS